MIDHAVGFMPRPRSDDIHYYPPFIYQNLKLLSLLQIIELIIREEELMTKPCRINE